MRKFLSFLTVVALLKFSCSKDEPNQSEELLSTDNFGRTAKEILKSEDFQNYLTANESPEFSAKSRQAENKGITIIQQGIFGFFPYYYDNGVFVIGVLFRPGDYKILPNGMGELSFTTEEPWVFLNDNELGIFDDSCYEEPSGTFTFKYKGTIEVETLPWGATRYRIVPPYNTSIVYRALNFKLNNADTYDEETDSYYCREENVQEVTVSAIRIGKVNNENEKSSDFLKVIIR